MNRWLLALRNASATAGHKRCGAPAAAWGCVAYQPCAPNAGDGSNGRAATARPPILSPARPARTEPRHDQPHWRRAALRRSALAYQVEPRPTGYLARCSSRAKATKERPRSRQDALARCAEAWPLLATERQHCCEWLQRAVAAKSIVENSAAMSVLSKRAAVRADACQMSIADICPYERDERDEKDEMDARGWGR
jgi:hypothetical protein